MGYCSVSEYRKGKIWMDENKRKQIVECMEKIEVEIAQEEGRDIEEIRNKIRDNSEVQNNLSHMDKLEFEEWRNKWWREDYYPNDTWTNGFRIYIFEKYLGKNGVYFNVKVSFDKNNMADVLASKLRGVRKIDVRIKEDKNSIFVIGLFDILEEWKVKDLIKTFCIDYPSVIGKIEYKHS